MEEKRADPGRIKFYVERQGSWTQAAVILMLLSAAFRLIGCWGLWGDPSFAATQIALPLCCNVLFILTLLLLGKHLFWATSLPVLLGVVFFIIRSFGFESWLHMVLCIMLYLLVAVLYTATAFGVVRSKWPLVPLFGLPLLYHLFVEDLAALRDTETPLSFSAGMQEMSVLCVLLALLCTAFAMKKKPAGKGIKAEENGEKPDPVPQPGPEAAPAAAPGDAPQPEAETPGEQP